MRAAGQAEKNIWAMSKEALTEVARKELGYTLPESTRLTVAVLRERIRANRELLKLQARRDPLATKPKGLTKLKLDDLTTEAANRGIVIDKPNRAKLIDAISEDVANRTLIQEMEEGQWTTVEPMEM